MSETNQAIQTKTTEQKETKSKVSKVPNENTLQILQRDFKAFAKKMDEIATAVEAIEKVIFNK